MSLHSLMRSAQHATVPASKAAPAALMVGGTPARGTEPAGTPPPNYGARVIEYFPSEVVAFYLFLVGLLAAKGDATAGQQWTVFGLGVAALLLQIAWLRRKTAPGISMRTLAVILGLSSIAFVAWAAAMPETPFLALSADANLWGSIGAAAVTFAAPIASDILGVPVTQPGS